jgi:RNA recognition motif-containing protein
VFRPPERAPHQRLTTQARHTAFHYAPPALSLRRKYKSFVKARVVRDKRTHKSRGYGFVSFLDAMDALAALKEVNGRYIGNRPVRLKRSTYEEKDATAVARREREEAARLAALARPKR